MCVLFFYFPSDGDCDSDFFRAATLPKLSTQGSALLIPSRRVGHLCSAGPAQGDLTSGQRPPSRVGHQVTVCDACATECDACATEYDCISSIVIACYLLAARLRRDTSHHERP